jgi:hypothetical protein
MCSTPGGTKDSLLLSKERDGLEANNLIKVSLIEEHMLYI